MKALRYSDKPKREAASHSDEPVQDKLAALKVDSEEAEGEAEAAPEPATRDPFQDVPVLSRTKAELYLFDTETDVFVIQEKDVDVDMASNGEYDSESTFLSFAALRTCADVASLDYRAA